MSRWFRHYAGLCRDDKLVSVAIKAKQPVERVVWVWAAILESAAEIDENGRYELDPAEVAYFLRADEDHIHSIEAALGDMGRVADGAVVRWGNRQFSSDRSKERVAAHRQRKRAEEHRTSLVEPSRNDDVTLQERHCNSPETETETDNQLAEANCPPAARRHVWPEDFVDQVWAHFPRKTEKKTGVDALQRLHRADRVAWADLMAGLDGLAGCDPQFVPALARWIKGERWKDERPASRSPPTIARNNRSLIDGLDEIERRFSDVPAPTYPRLAG